MSERLRYLTDEEMLHDGTGEGFGVPMLAVPQETQPVVPVEQKLEQAFEIMEERFRLSIRESMQRIKNDFSNEDEQTVLSKGIDLQASIAIEEKSIALLEGRFRTRIHAGLQELRANKSGSITTNSAYGQAEQRAIHQMDTDGIMLFSASNSPKES